MSTSLRTTAKAAVTRPYPWGALDATSRVEAAGVHALRRWAAARVRLEDVARALEELLGAHVAIRMRQVRRAAARGNEDGVGLLLAEADVTDIRRGVLLEAEGALAAALVARGVRRSTPRVIDASRPASPVVAGALGAIVVAAARRAHAGAALRVLAAGPANALARDLAAFGGELIQASFTVIVESDAYEARATIPFATIADAPPPPWSARALTALGDVPLAIPIVACASLATAGDVGSLMRGDAWMPGPGEWRLRRTKGTALLVGPVVLAPGASERGIGADLGEDGRLVLRGDVQELAWAPSSKENDVSEQAKSDALVDAVGEVPVVVRVEIGVAEMRARDWAEVGRGDVIALGRKIGEPVTLRVGGVTVARGELVEIEGEIGVRILGRADRGESGGT